MSQDITLRAYDALADLMQRTSQTPSKAEVAKLLEEFALEFGRDVASRLVSTANTDDYHYVINAVVDRAARGEA